MSKPQPRRIPSDDCVVTIDGHECRPHEGEWVEVYRGRTIAETAAIARLVALQADLAAAIGAEDEQLRVSVELDAAFDTVCTLLARRLVAWTWTDLAGRPLPQPDGRAEQLKALESAEVAWLLEATRETPAPSAAESEVA